MIQTLTCRMEIASAYGLDCAVFMHHIVHWAMKNEAEGQHFHDGRYWAYSSYAGLVRWFSPLWSIQQVKRLVAKCKDAGILLVGDYNEDSKSRTNWYAPSDEILKVYALQELAPGMVRNRTKVGSESDQGRFEIEPHKINNNINTIPPIAPQGAEAGEKPKRSPKSIPKHKPERFEAFWAAYPRGEARSEAVREWDKLKADDATLDAMALALREQLKSEMWREGKGIPYAVRWLRNRRWEDTGLKLPLPDTGDYWAEDPER